MQKGGIEQWLVGSYESSQLDSLIKELSNMGEIKYKNVSKTNWSDLVH